MTKFAEIAPQKERMEAITTTATCRRLMMTRIILAMTMITMTMRTRMMMTMMTILRILRTVLPALATMLPMQRDRMNCARKTMQETMAMSVPIPRTYMEEEMEEESFLKAIVKM